MAHICIGLILAFQVFGCYSQFEVYKSLCQTVEKKVALNDDEFDYFPSHYVEKICSKTGSNSLDLSREGNRQMCNIPGFHCVQNRAQMSFVRRRKHYGNWEPFTQEIMSHCECMWPTVE